MNIINKANNRELIRALYKKVNQMRLAENHKENLLFVNSQGNYADPKNANKFLKSTLKKSKYK